MERVHTHLEREPVTLTVNDPAGKPMQIRLGAFAVQLLTSFAFIPDPDRIVRLPEIYAAMDAGVYQPAADLIARALVSELTRMKGMPQLMDLASGVSGPRLERARRQAGRALLGDAGNFPMPQIHDIAPDLVLHDDFRAPLATEVPTLLVMGTMDGRTPVESQEELLPQFRRATRLTVVNAGHNIFEQSEAAQQDIVRFLQTGTVGTNQIALPPPAFKR
jgi:pimeloyl-ACP methyl ester carboxylesterase